MNVIHLPNVSSTQSYLKQNFERLAKEDPEIIVTTNKQNKGKGRNDNKWVSFPESIAFSFAVKPQENVTLTSLEMGCLISQYLELIGMECFLKWPNDILNADKLKCGGIISQIVNSHCICGVGINIYSSDDDPENNDFEYGFAGTSKNVGKNYKEELPPQIYQYILENRMTENEILKNWPRLCAHNNIEVFISENNDVINGKFKGIGSNGEALVKGDSNIIKIYNGTLRF